jgi:hypothetical protein
MAEMGGYIIDGLKNGIGDVWNKIKEKFTTFWTNIKSWFDGKVENFKNLGSNMIAKIKNGIGGVWSTIKDKFTTFWTNLKGWFDGKVESFKNLGSNMIAKIKSGVGNVWNSIKEKFTTFWTNLKSWFDGKVTSLKNLGGNIISGIKKGITEKIGEIKTALTDGLSSALSSVKKLLGIHSPSRVFRDEVGQYIALGLGEGITDNIPEVVEDVSTLAGAISDEISNNEFAISPIGVDGANTLVDGMNNFAGIITDGFTTLVEKLENIANGVNFAIPGAVNIIPYKSKTDDNDVDFERLFELSNDDLIHALIQLFDNQTDELKKVIEGLNLNVTLDSKKQVDDTIAEINRRIRVTGNNPLLT